MMLRSLCSVVALAAALFGPEAMAQASAGVDQGDLHTRIARMEERIRELESTSADWMTEERAAELRELVEAVLADADSRTALVSQQSNAGWDGHPFLASADSAFRLELEGRFQLRYIFNHQDAPDGGGDTSRGGFEGRRIRTIFSGHVIDPSLTYKVQATYDRRGGAFELEDAFIEKELDNGLSLKVGQFRPPLTRESNVSTFRTTAVERAIAHGAIEISRTQGIELAWRDDVFSLRGSFHDGDGFANTPALTADTEFAFAARAEAKLAGSWRQFNDFTGWTDGAFGLLVGAGINYQRGEFGSTNPMRADDVRWTVDASAEFSGAHLYGMVGGHSIDPDRGDAIDVLVAVIQGGVFITEEVELFGRYEWGDDDLSGTDDLHLLTLGLTRFWNKHDLKWQLDAGYAFDAVSATFASSGAGWREDSADQDGQIVIRTQLQVSF